jgi:TPR repeat protein
MSKSLQLLFSIYAVTLAAGCASSPSTDPAAAKKVFDEGVVAYDAKNYEQAFKLFSSVDDTDLAAMRNVALMLRKGLGTAKDPRAAEEMYARAADGGLPTAAADLGEMLLNGEAGAPDAKAALPYLAAAAEAGHPIAAYELGQMYEAGNGTAKDLKTARQLYEMAARMGVEDARKRLAALPPP